ncbi:MAG: acetyl-CoA carboxylase, carboxyltransferase subunit beta [Bacillota bacterium]|nr:acetyl-CoA carboxylase, carboxyltransferase subunit beta [Bacillota bacterium]
MLKGLIKKSGLTLEDSIADYSKPMPSIPDEICISCISCKQVILVQDMLDNLKVCPKCGYHSKLSSHERLAITFDESTFTEWDAALESKNILGFPEYDEKLATAKKSSGMKEAVLTGKAKLDEQDCAVVIMENKFMLGSMGFIVGEKVTRAFEKATEQRLPVIAFTVSGGARMQEGIISLMQMAKTSGAVKRHSDAGLLYITVLTDPTTGGVTASFAMEGDIVIAEPDALVGFAGRRVIEQTTRTKLPDRFQKAEFVLEKGFIDMIVARSKMRETLSALLRLHGGVKA